MAKKRGEEQGQAKPKGFHLRLSFVGSLFLPSLCITRYWKSARHGAPSTHRGKARLVHGQPFPLALYTIPSASQRIIYACDALWVCRSYWRTSDRFMSRGALQSAPSIRTSTFYWTSMKSLIFFARLCLLHGLPDQTRPAPFRLTRLKPIKFKACSI